MRGGVPGRAALLAAVVLLCGFTSLVFEVTYYRMLAFVLGSTVRSSAIVLSAYMAGLAAGAFVLGRWFGRWRADRLLGGLLAYKGLAGLAIYYVFHVLVYAEGAQVLLSNVGVVTAGSFALVFLHALASGGFLPVLYRVAFERDQELPAGIGHYYALETLGSALGALAVGFVLIRHLGQHLTLICVAGVDLLLALLVGVLLSGASASRPEEGYDDRGNRLIYFYTFVFGFVGLALQVVWIRALRVYLQNSTYTFSLIAFIVIVSFFLGSAAYRVLAARIRERVRLLEALIWPFSVFAALTVFWLVGAPRLVILPIYESALGPVANLLLPPLLIALAMALPVGLISGFCFPLCCVAVTRSRAVVGASTGTLTLFNSLGALLGPLFTGLVLLPSLGLIRSVLLLAALPVAALLAGRAGCGRASILAVGACGAWILAAGLVGLGWQGMKILPVQFSAGRGGLELVHYQETPGGIISVSRDGRGTYRIHVDDSFVIGSDADAMAVVKMLGHLPFLAGSRAETALVVGFGAGVTTAVIASYPQIRKVTCVELAIGLRETAHFFERYNDGVIDSPKLRLVEGDGRRYLAGTRETFDLISSDPTHPILGSHAIYTYEYFELCRRRLNPGGFVSQYLPLHLLLTPDFVGIIEAFRRAFPELLIFMSRRHAILLGSDRKLEIDFREWHAMADRIRDPGFYADPYHLASKLIADGEALRGAGVDYRLNRDDRSPVEFFDFRSSRPANWSANAAFLGAIRIDLERVFRNLPNLEVMELFVAGDRLLLDAMICLNDGDISGYYDNLRAARRVNPLNLEYGLLLGD